MECGLGVCLREVTVEEVPVEEVVRGEGWGKPPLLWEGVEPAREAKINNKFYRNYNSLTQNKMSGQICILTTHFSVGRTKLQ